MMIDLRSDTVTKPSQEMLEFMMKAKVGDDVYGEDDTINELQQKVAKLFGKEDALFVPSGTMSNQIAIAVNTQQGDEILCEKNSHIFYYETAAPSIISKVQIRTFDAPSGVPSIEQIEPKIRDDIYYYPNTTLFTLENTHNRYGGLVVDNEKITDIANHLKTKNIKLHLDAARLWNAHIYSGVTMKEYSQNFDTISLCFSKGLGAPVGSILIGDKATIKKSLKWRKILGGGMRQAGILAAACIFAMDNNLEKLKLDHQNTKFFADELVKVVKEISNKFGIDNDILKIKNEIQTNILAIEFSTIYFDKSNFNIFINNLKNSGILLNTLDDKTIRLVFHLDISTEMTQKAISIFSDCIFNTIKAKLN